jgi:hypothetical protein
MMKRRDFIALMTSEPHFIFLAARRPGLPSVSVGLERRMR